jgi:hypothetical protein
MLYAFKELDRANSLLKNVIRGGSARRKRTKKRSLHEVNEHFEFVSNAAMRPSARFSTGC